MIDEKKLIEDLKNTFSDSVLNQTFGFGKYTLLEAVEEMINRQPKADWISCEVDMPPQPKKNPLYENKPLQVYLVSVKNCEEPFRAFWNGKDFTDGWSKLNVEAWMPLPAPYKKEGAENE